MQNHEFPILEFDPDTNAFIMAEKLIQPINISKRAVLCFFLDAIEKFLSECPYEIVAHLKGEGISLPVYEVMYKGEKIVLVQSIPGAPMAASHLEELTALGCRKYIACGGCGVLQKELAVGHLIIPATAVRDEGTSYHYAPPSREIAMSEHSIKVVEETLTRNNAPYIKGKTWTTDAFFRETPARVARRRQEGCIAVEMETSAFIAVAQFKQIDFGQILYAGDNLDGAEWDSRSWKSRTDIREHVLKLALDACLQL